MISISKASIVDRNHLRVLKLQVEASTHSQGGAYVV